MTRRALNPAETEHVRTTLAALVTMPWNEMAHVVGTGLPGTELRLITLCARERLPHWRLAEFEAVIADALARVDGDGVPPDLFERDRVQAAAVVLATRAQIRKRFPPPSVTE